MAKIPNPRPLFELNKHIDITLGPETVSQNGPEKCEFANIGFACKSRRQN